MVLSALSYTERATRYWREWLGSMYVLHYTLAVQGVLSTELDAPAEVGTTVKESYLPPTPPRVRTTGAMVAACLLVFDQSAVITPVYTPPHTHTHTHSHTLLGKRQEQLKQQLFEMVRYVSYHTALCNVDRVQHISSPSCSSEVHEEFHPPPPSMDYTSTTMKDFGKGLYLH